MLALRSLYNQYGYQPFKMSKFEEYDLYVRNKDFLVSDSIITFTDTNGKLLALKPDVTLSIIKNTADEEGNKQKVYYNENVYRLSGSTHQFKEIMQSGIECIGDIDSTDVFEVVYIAAKSLSMMSDEFILDISHMGLYSAMLDEVSTDKVFRKQITELIAEKNRHEALALCEKYQITKDKSAVIEVMLSLYGNLAESVDAIFEICKNEKQLAALNELRTLADLFANTEFAEKIKFDFSVINDMRYYDGIVFKGFINGIYEDVLTGGKYDPLMKRMGRTSSAIGFAVYVDLLSQLSDSNTYDVDVLMIYDEKTTAETIILKKEELIRSEKSVFSSRIIPTKLRYKELIDLSKEAAK
ncbi:MAG: ATP phosphoribosyltransferase regulatory subunit [Clostridia bacterium]|nr:ATP phosphoribosyltransferase regulatory subunit [Clostridia bacterium]